MRVIEGDLIRRSARIEVTGQDQHGAARFARRLLTGSGSRHPMQLAELRIRWKEIEVTTIEAMRLQHIFLLLGQPGGFELADQGVMDHAPEFEPTCSMSRERIVELMDQAFAPVTSGNGVCSWSSITTKWTSMS